MTVTFKDVAQLAGVSTQTVSRVTNGAGSVSEKTRVKVLSAIEQLGYIPNKAAQSLKSNNKIIGVVTLNMSFHGAAMIANGVRLRAHELGYATAITAVDKVCEQEIENAVRELIGQKVESIILITPVSGEFAKQLSDKYAQFHLLFIDAPEGTNVHKIFKANQSGAILGAQHLIDSGRKKFVLITGPGESYASNTRVNTWKQTLSENNIPIVGTYEGNWLAAGGYRAMVSALSMSRDFDAVLVANDQMALGVMRALHEQQINIPDDVSVVGFDGTEDSEFFTPPLTTVRQNFIGQGHIAMDELLVNSEQRKRTKPVLDVELIVRESSSTAPQKNDNATEIKVLLDKAIRLL